MTFWRLFWQLKEVWVPNTPQEDLPAKTGHRWEKDPSQTPNGFCSCELRSYHPNLFSRRIKLKSSPPWIHLQEPVSENFRTNQKIRSRIWSSTMVRRADLGTRLGVNLGSANTCPQAKQATETFLFFLSLPVKYVKYYLNPLQMIALSTVYMRQGM